ncbi:MAG TPA: P-II family nitrogen regulator [Gemmatimonadales bacterium]
MGEVRAIVRMEMLGRVVHRLKECGCPRLTVTRVHAIGAGADPARGPYGSLRGLDPVFNNATSMMPNLGLTRPQVDAITAYLAARAR